MCSVANFFLYILMVVVFAWVYEIAVGADLSRPSPIYRPPPKPRQDAPRF